MTATQGDAHQPLGGDRIVGAAPTVQRSTDRFPQPSRLGCLLGCEGFGHDPDLHMIPAQRGTCDRPCQAWTISRLTGDGGVGIPPRTCDCPAAVAAHAEVPR